MGERQRRPAVEFFKLPDAQRFNAVQPLMRESLNKLFRRVHFEDGRLLVALEGPEATYLERLTAFLEDGRARRADG